MAVLLCAPGALLAQSVTPAPSLHYRVAAILPLTGDGASWGLATKAGMEIALSKLDQETRAQLDVTYEDDGLLPKNTVSAFQRMSSASPIDVLVNITSSTGNAVAPLAEKMGIPFFAIASDSHIGEGRPHVLMFFLDPEDEAARVVDEMVRRGYKSVAEVIAIQDGYLAGQDAFRRKSKGKLDVVLSEQFTPDTTDFKGFIGKLRRAAKPVDAVYVLLMPGQVGAYAKQSQELGITLPLVGGINFENRGEVDASGGALIGQWFVTNGNPDGAFLKEYNERFPGQPLACATNGHDVIALLAQALHTKIPAKELASYLRQLPGFDGASGQLRMGENGRFRFPTAVKRVTGTGYETLEDGGTH